MRLNVTHHAHDPDTLDKDGPQDLTLKRDVFNESLTNETPVKELYTAPPNKTIRRHEDFYTEEQLTSPSLSEGFTSPTLSTQDRTTSVKGAPKKNEAYWEKRRRNNAAARRSREKRRQNDRVLEQRVRALTTENNLLKRKLHLELSVVDDNFHSRTVQSTAVFDSHMSSASASSNLYVVAQPLKIPVEDQQAPPGFEMTNTSTPYLVHPPTVLADPLTPVTESLRRTPTQSLSLGGLNSVTPSLPLDLSIGPSSLLQLYHAAQLQAFSQRHTANPQFNRDLHNQLSPTARLMSPCATVNSTTTLPVDRMFGSGVFQAAVPERSSPDSTSATSGHTAITKATDPLCSLGPHVVRSGRTDMPLLGAILSGCTKSSTLPLSTLSATNGECEFANRQAKAIAATNDDLSLKRCLSSLAVRLDSWSDTVTSSVNENTKRTTATYCNNQLELENDRLKAEECRLKSDLNALRNVLHEHVKVNTDSSEDDSHSIDDDELCSSIDVDGENEVW